MLRTERKVASQVEPQLQSQTQTLSPDQLRQMHPTPDKHQQAQAEERFLMTATIGMI